MLKDAIYGGVNAAVLTPMRADGSVDLDRMAAHGKWLLANGCDGLGILGTTGEANSIGTAERVELMGGLLERGLPARKLMPGTGATAVADVVLLTRTAAKLGCPGVLVLPPFYYKNPSEDGLVAFFSEVIDKTGGETKLYLYHIPQMSAVPITHGLIERLMKRFPGVVKGLKDSTGDFAQTKGFVDAFASEGFEVYCGDDGALLRNLQAGGAGCITAAANVGSAVSAQVYRGWDSEAAAAAQERLSAIRKAVTTAPLIPALKALVARNTGDRAWLNMRPPHLPLGAEAERALFAAFDAVGFELAKAA